MVTTKCFTKGNDKTGQRKKQFNQYTVHRSEHIEKRMVGILDGIGKCKVKFSSKQMCLKMLDLKSTNSLHSYSKE